MCEKSKCQHRAATVGNSSGQSFQVPRDREDQDE